MSEGGRNGRRGGRDKAAHYTCDCGSPWPLMLTPRAPVEPQIRNRTGFGLGAAARQALDFGTLETAEAGDLAVDEEHRHLMTEASPERLVRIDVHDGDVRGSLAEELIELLMHPLTEVAVDPADQSPSRRGGVRTHGRGDIACARFEGCTEPAMSSTVRAGTSPTAVI